MAGGIGLKRKGAAMVTFCRLQNENRIIGEYGNEAAEDIKLSREVAGQITGAYVYWLSLKVQKNPVMLNVCVGRDEYSDIDEIEEGVFEAIALWGAKIHDAGIVTTEAAASAPNLPCFEIDGSIMISGNDLLRLKIGFRFFTPEGEPNDEDIKEILRLASKYNFIGGEYEKEDIPLMKMYELYK